jgi:hypothetical protein
VNAIIEFMHVKMVTRNHLVALLAIVGLIGTTVTTTTTPVYARHHLHITIYGHGEVTVNGPGYAPDVTLDCEPGSGFGYSITARC